MWKKYEQIKEFIKNLFKEQPVNNPPRIMRSIFEDVKELIEDYYTCAKEAEENHRKTLEMFKDYIKNSEKLHQKQIDDVREEAFIAGAQCAMGALKNYNIITEDQLKTIFTCLSVKTSSNKKRYSVEFFGVDVFGI